MKTVQQVIFDDEVMTAFGGGGGFSSRSFFSPPRPTPSFSGTGLKAPPSVSSQPVNNNTSSVFGFTNNRQPAFSPVQSALSNNRTNLVQQANSAQARANLYSGISTIATGWTLTGRVWAAPTAAVTLAASQFHQSRANTLNALAGVPTRPSPINLDTRDWNQPRTTPIARRF